jgi:hypothetical protein
MGAALGEGDGEATAAADRTTARTNENSKRFMRARFAVAPETLVGESKLTRA